VAADDLYREYLVELYRHPHNYGLMAAPDLRQEGQNPLCGDEVTIDLRLEGERVAEARFEGRGCAVSMAAASILTDLAPGRTLAELVAMGDEEMLAEIGLPSLTPARRKCALLALKTLQVGARARGEAGVGAGAEAGSGKEEG
jgi:nitrogen fixation NifU-like protein